MRADNLLKKPICTGIVAILIIILIFSIGPVKLHNEYPQNYNFVQNELEVFSENCDIQNGVYYKNQISDMDNYTKYENDDHNFKIKVPGEWVLMESEAGGEYLGIQYDFIAEYKEPSNYPGNARLEFRTVINSEVQNSESYLSDLIIDILDYTYDKPEILVTDAPEYFEEDDTWFGEIKVRTTYRGESYKSIVRLAVSEFHETLYILTATSLESEFQSYEKYFNTILDSFEITGEFSDIIALGICLGMVVIIITIIVLIYTRKKTLEEERRKDTFKPPPSSPKTQYPSYPRPKKPTTYPLPGTTTPQPKPVRIEKKTYSRTESCRVCGGLGRCNECDGLGTVSKGMFGQNIVPCPNCNGKGMCKACRGG